MWYSFRNSPYNQGTSQYVFKNKDLDIKSTYIDGIIWGTCVIDEEDSLYVGSSSGKFFKINKNGHIVWKYNLISKTDSLVDSAACLHPMGFVVVPGGDGYLHALDLNDGKALWVLKAPHNVNDKIDRSGAIVNSFEGNVTVSLKTGIIYAGCDNGFFYAVAPDGKEVWSVKTNMMIWSCAAFLYINGKEYVTFGCLDNFLYIVDCENGYVIDKYNTGAEIKSSPLVDGNTIYICNSNGKLICLNFTGEKITNNWIQDYGTEIYSSPTLKDNILVVCTFEGLILGLSTLNRHIIWQHKVYNSICCSPIITGDNVVILGDSNGVLYGFNLYDGAIEVCTKITNHKFRNNINASPALDSNGLIHIGCYDGYIHHLSYKKCHDYNRNHIPDFIRKGKTHLELEYDGDFIKSYRVRSFDSTGNYIEKASVDVSSVYLNSTSNSQLHKLIISSDGKNINFVQTCDKPIDITISGKLYDQTNNWFKDRLQPSNILLTQQKITHEYKFINSNILQLSDPSTVYSWEITNFSILQPRILDTYIPAALMSVTYKLYLFSIPKEEKKTKIGGGPCIDEQCYKINENKNDYQDVLCLMVPTVKNHNNDDSLIVIPEPQKVLLMDGKYHGNTIIAQSRNAFQFSSMGGTMKFNEFQIYISLDPHDKSLKTEFICSTSCLSIKGNNDNYKFSSEIVNQLCDPLMNIYALGTCEGKLVDLKTYPDASSLKSVKSLFGLRTSTYLNVKIPIHHEAIITIIYNTHTDHTYKISSFIYVAPSIKIPNDTKHIWMFIDDIFVGYISSI